MISKRLFRAATLLGLLGVLAGCDPGRLMPFGAPADSGAGGLDEERGPNGGRVLRDGDFALELAIFETGLPPEFRAWATAAGAEVAPGDVDLIVTLTRLGGRVDEIRFGAQNGFLRGGRTVDEPHSFVVLVEATYDGRRHRWEYESFEGRTRISAEMARELGIGTTLAGPAVIEHTITLYGRIVPNAERVSVIGARFDGVIRSVAVSIGDTVLEGQTLAVIESDESLQSYAISSPIGGVVTERAANAGESTRGRPLFTIMDLSSVWADIAVFPAHRSRVSTGAPVTVAATSGGPERGGTVSRIDVLADENQTVTARVVLDNRDGAFPPGLFVRAGVTVAEHEVPLAVRRNGLQSFRDFTVVYAQVGDEYEVRMLELGRQDREWAEVLDGLEPGTRYVTEGSYVVKADVEKSGATHDH